MRGSIFDVGSPCDIENAIVRNNGNEIAFDYEKDEEDGHFRYTVTVRRVNGNLFQGKAISQPKGKVAEVTCRVYRHEGITVLVGSHWKYPDSENYRWLVELQV